MSQVIDINESRMLVATRRAYRNWNSHFKEEFGPVTRTCHLSLGTLSYLAQPKEKGTFLLYDLIMNLKGLGSGFEFEGMSPDKKMIVIDHYLFLLDRLRFECMKRLGWLQEYPGEEYPLVELISDYEMLAPGLCAKIPVPGPDFPPCGDYYRMNNFEREAHIRKQIPTALEAIESRLKNI